MKLLTISKLARKAAVTIDTVRFYERRGLIKPAARSASNYRIYQEKDVDRLRFIRHAKELGFSLAEIKELLALRHDPNATKADVKSRAEAKVRDIKVKIRDLTRIVEVLEHLVEACDGDHGPTTDCPILAALETDHCKVHNHKHEDRA